MNMHNSGGAIKAVSFLGRIKKRTWIIIGVVILTLLALFLWLIISIATWLWGKASSGDMGSLIPENALAQIQQLSPELAQSLEEVTQPLEQLAQPLEQLGQPLEQLKQPLQELTQPLENVVPEAKAQALELVEQAQNVVPELKNQVEQMVPNIDLNRALPERDVSGTDPSPVARFPGLVRTSFVRNGEQLTVDYEGRARLTDALDHYLKGFVDAGFSHEVLRADGNAEVHKFVRGDSAVQLSLMQTTTNRLYVQLKQIP
uniref:hypothetical protein n=1 Tax=Cellvibrio fontiphilus TaxID=1815559 RepID=UPI002B4C12DF|nr:hypothetical protein [Cellvibrio fontiphilus]